VSGKPTVLGTRGLLEAIEGPVETTNKVRVCRILEPKRLSTVDCLGHHPMKEGILDVQLMNSPVLRKGQGEHHTNRRGLHHWTEGLIIVHTGVLREATKNPMYLVPLKGAIGLELVLENPLPRNDIGLRRTRDKILGVVRKQCGASSIAAHQFGSAMPLRNVFRSIDV